MNTLKLATGPVLAQTDFSNVTSNTQVNSEPVTASINTAAVYGVLGLIVLLMIIAMIVVATREKRVYVEELDDEEYQGSLDEPVAHHMHH